MSKYELISKLTQDYNEDKDELRNYSKLELEQLLNEYEDHSNMFPNGDEYDGSYEWD